MNTQRAKGFQEFYLFLHKNLLINVAQCTSQLKGLVVLKDFQCYIQISPLYKYTKAKDLEE